MRCVKLQRRVDETGPEGLSEVERQHFRICSACQAYARGAARLTAGLRLLAQETEPVPSWGFTARVLRRLDQVPAMGFSAQEFIESAGWRVMITVLILAGALFLAMILPSSGPLRQSQQPIAYWPSAQAENDVYPIPAQYFPPIPAIFDAAQQVTFHR